MKSAKARRIKEKTEEADGSFMLFSRSDLVSVLPLLALQVQVPASDRQAEGCHKQLLH